MKIQRLLVSLEIAVRGHLLNPFWKDKSSRWRKKKEVQTQILTRYLKRYLYAAEAVKEKEVVNNDAEDRIFTLWLQGEENAPELVKACIRSMRHHCTQQLVVLDEKTLFEYIDLPTEIVEKYKAGKIRRAHFADICAWNYYTVMEVIGLTQLYLSHLPFQTRLRSRISLFISPILKISILVVLTV